MLIRLLLVLLLLAATVGLSRWVPRHPRWRPLVIALNLAVTIRYLWWRGTQTLNWESGWGIAVSLTVYLAEIYGFLVVLHHYLIATRATDRHVPQGMADFRPTVDLLVTTYDEGTDILYRTLVGCLAIDYPAQRIHVLDDGRRPEVAELCRRLGVEYVSRADNAGAKAGNLNNALSRTTGELVATLDADHVPVRSFLAETVPHFREGGVAQVQTAHHFYNPDLFQDRLRIRAYVANEQDMFYHVVQPGRDVYNSSFYCGSGAVFRRSALEEIGGFPTATVTEDLHTSVLLHNAGWKSIYVNRDLSAGLAPESYDAYLTQRRRWALGTFQTLLARGGLFLPGLSVMQRINYLATLWYWLYGFPRSVYLLAPLAFLLAGLRPLIVHDVTELLTYYLPHLCVSIVAFQLVNRGMRRIFWSDVYESCISVHMALAAILFPFRARRARFVVTPKGRAAEEGATTGFWRLGWPVLCLIGLMAVGVVTGVFTLARRGAADDGTLINVIWATYNVVILGFGLLVLRATPQRRTAVRLPRRFPCLLAWNGTRVPTETTDLSESGLSFSMAGARRLPAFLDLTLTPAGSEPLVLRGRLTRCDVAPDGSLSAAVDFADRSEAQHRRLVEILFCREDSWAGPHGLTMGAPEHLRRIAGSVVAIFSRARTLRRLSPRFLCDLPVTLLTADRQPLAARALDISGSGIALRLAPGQPVPSPERFRVTVEWNAVERTTFDARVRHVRNGASGERIVGVALVDPDSEQRRDLDKHLYAAAIPQPERKAS
jgi:cellulose synthase (UDP-forming)